MEERRCGCREWKEKVGEMVYVELTKANGCRMGGGEAWRGRDPCIGRGGKAEVCWAGVEKGEKTKYLGLERGRKEQSSGDKELKKSKLKSPVCVPLKFTKETKNSIWKHGTPDGSCFSRASPVPISCLGSKCKFQGTAFHFWVSRVWCHGKAFGPALQPHCL